MELPKKDEQQKTNGEIGTKTPEPPEDPDFIEYIEEMEVYPLPWIKRPLRINVQGWRSLFMTLPLIVALVLVVLGSWLWLQLLVSKLPVREIFQWTVLIGVLGGIIGWIVWPLYRLIDQKIVMAPKILQMTSTFYHILVIRREDEKKVVRMLRFTATCPVCGGLVEIQEGARRLRGRYIGACDRNPVSNLVCRSMDRDLTDLARRNLARYTRYADDITFSFRVRKTSRLPAAVCVVDDDGDLHVGTELHDLIANKHHFTINPTKTRLSDRGRRMEVTGLTINQFPNVPRVFVDRIRGALHAWEKYGYEAADEQWKDRVTKAATGAYEKKPWKRQTRRGKVPELKNVLWGKLLYLRMVRGKDDIIYTRLAERFNSAVLAAKAVGPFSAPKLPVEPVVRDNATARDACFVVECMGEYQSTPGKCDDFVCNEGTAFVYRELNVLVTCDHLFNFTATVNNHEFPTDYDAPELFNKTLNIVHPGTKQRWHAKILYRDAPMDLALIAFEDPVPPHRYFSAIDNPIEPSARGILIGYPAWKQWNLPDFNAQQVLNRISPHAGMNSFTITGAGSIRPGNSGGPFTDDRFRVAGMAQRGAYMGDGHDECLCFEIVDDLISKYKTSLIPPAAKALPAGAVALVATPVAVHAAPTASLPTASDKAPAVTTDGAASSD